MALWDPTNYTAGLLKEWHDPSNSSNITQSGGLITQDNDLSGNSNHDTAAGAPRPTYTTAAINSLNAETYAASVPQWFTGVLDYSTLTSSAIIWVVQRSTAASYKTLVGAATTAGLQIRISNVHKLEMLSENTTLIATSTNTVPTTTSIVAATLVRSTSWSFRTDGTANGGSTTTAAPPSSVSLVARNPLGATEYFDGILGERITIGGVTLSDIQLAEGYLAWKWGTVSTLDASHPYKSAAPTAGGGTSPFIFPRSRHYVRR